MSTALPEPSASADFRPDQRAYLEDLFARLAADGLLSPASDGMTDNPARRTAPATFHNTPVDELNQQERWKLAEHPLDGWDRLLAHAAADKAPDAEHNYRFRWYGLFHVAPAQDSFMLRLRLPGCSITSYQLHGLADLATELCGGYAHVTTRGNLQLREIKPRNAVAVLSRLSALGLSARGSGADNLRNITASPDSGFAPDEILDVRPYALALQEYVYQSRDLYDLPRKFNIAFDNGGSLSVAADTNDIAFVATRVASAEAISNFKSENSNTPSETLFRVLLGGITGHKDFARDTGVVCAPDQAVSVAVAMMRVFIDHGDRTNRKKARLKYLLEAKGVAWFLEETARRLSFPLRRLPPEATEPRRPVVKHAWLGPRPQRQPGLRSLGIGCPVGRLTAKQMHRLADLAAHYGKGELRLTVWQNVLIPHIPAALLSAVQREVVAMGLYHEAHLATGGIVACTGSWGCKYASADTKAHAAALIKALPSRIQIDLPVNIHLTGCAHSCAQHYCGDLGFISTKLADGSPGYHMVLGGGMDNEQGIAREVFKGIPATELTDTVVRVLAAWQKHRAPGETFAHWTRRHDLNHLQQLLA